MENVNTLLTVLNSFVIEGKAAEDFKDWNDWFFVENSEFLYKNTFEITLNEQWPVFTAWLYDFHKITIAVYPYIVHDFWGFIVFAHKDNSNYLEIDSSGNWGDIIESEWKAKRIALQSTIDYLNGCVLNR